MMKKLPLQAMLSCISILMLLFCMEGFAQQKKKILVFYKTAGFHHDSIDEGIAAILKMGAAHQFDVDTTKNSALFSRENLKKYQAVVFLNTTGDVLNDEQQQAFEQFIQSGNGFVGVHAATDTEYNWPWYGNLVGAYFSAHPQQQEAVLKVVNRETIATSHLPEVWKRKDEWYNFKWMTKNPITVLLTIDETSYNPGKGAMGANHPMSWYQSFDGGRSFYTELGHTKESYHDPLFLQHLLGGLRYAMGEKKMSL